MVDDATKSDTRSVELEIEVDAPVGVVWHALTDAEQLARWFPLTARIENPGPGGSVFVSWGEGKTEWESRIDVWQPDKHLQWVDPPSTDKPSATAVAIDYYLTARGDKTVLRLVQSGFSSSSDWDEYYDATVGGWTYFLFNLRHYLERHRDTPRNMVWVRRSVSQSKTDMWGTLFGPEGMGYSNDPKRMEDGDAFELRLDDVAIQGTTVLARPPVHFAATMKNLNDGLLFVEFEPGRDRWHCGIWLSTYGLEPSKVTSLQTALDRFADRLFRAAVSS